MTEEMNPNNGNWRPLLTGSQADQAVAAVEDIAAALGAWIEDPASDGGLAGRGASLAGGSAGLALFYAYLEQVRPGAGHGETAVALLDTAVEALATRPMMPGFHSGFSGVAWVSQHLEGRLFESPEGDEDPNLEIDRAIARHMTASPWPADYDLINGLVGFGVYALERLPRPSARRCLERMAARLEEVAHRRPEGLAFYTAPHLLPDHQRELCPEGYYNLGVAHGLPAALPVLAGALRAGVAPRRARRLLDGAVSWLLAQRSSFDNGSCFTYSIAEGVEPRGSRSAWCYGDPGIAASLLASAEAMGESSWREVALDVGRRAAARSAEGSGVQDAGLCHGSAGLGHVFNRLYQASGDEALAAAARSWFGHTVTTFRQPGKGFAGFPSWESDPDGSLAWHDDPGFLTGAAGVGLALLAAVSDVEPAWDRVLAISLPPPAPA